MKSKKIKAVITSPDIYPDSVKNLASFGIEVLFSFKNTNVSLPLAYHTDMQLTKISDDFFVCAPECFEYYRKILNKFNKKIIKGNTYLSCNYPHDIAYNIIVTENYAVHNFKYTDSVVKSKIESKTKINVPQGYTACTLCLISENAAITSDAGIYKILLSNGFDVLMINDNNVLLPGFDHGFLGGSSFLLEHNILAVNGKIENHPDYSVIKDFCLKHNVSLLSLSNNPIMDIGSVISLHKAD